MNKILLVIIALIVGLGAFIFLGNKTTNPSIQQPESTSIEKSASRETEQQREVVNVALGNNGFTPKDITVKAGTRIVWTNSSGKSATVSSDDHPTHRLYPFLNLGEFANSTTVQIAVEKPGKYSYHNHLNANEVGTITVE